MVLLHMSIFESLTVTLLPQDSALISRSSEEEETSSGGRQGTLHLLFAPISQYIRNFVGDWYRFKIATSC